MDWITPQTIIQGGATTIALALVVLLYKIITNHSVHTNAVIDRNTEAIIDEAKTHQAQIDMISQQTKVLEKLTEVIDRKL